MDSVPRGDWTAAIAFAIACVLAFFAYHLGLPGHFYFDDYANLNALGAHGGVRDWETLRLYLTDFLAGPSGRPIALLSFLIDAQTWPAEPEGFKRTNILIHILNGILLFWCLYLALTPSKFAARPGQGAWIAAIAAAWWLLTPLHVSTILYVVQRMAELSTLFVLLGILGYLLGRRRLDNAPRSGYAILGTAVVLGTVGATFSKENGALLPLLLLVMEFTLLPGSVGASPTFRWRMSFLAIPSIALILYILYWGVDANADMVAFRGYGIFDRLLTESRIVSEYLGYLLVPRPGTLGMFRDDIVVSTSLMQPVSTLFAVLTIVSLVVASVWLRKRLPLVSAAILFFIAGHLMESTVIPLELYFEHRNYLPSLLLFLPFAQALVWWFYRSPRASVVVGGLVFALLATTLAARAHIWSDRVGLYRVWAINNPHSPRAQLSLVNVLENEGRRSRAIEHLQRVIEAIPDNLLLRLYLVRLRALDHEPVSAGELNGLLALAARAPFSHEAVRMAEAITDDVLDHRYGGVATDWLLRLWQALAANPNPAYLKHLGALIHHQMGRLYLVTGNIEQAYQQFLLALHRAGSSEAGLKQAAVLATKGYYCYAIKQLQEADALLTTDPQASQRGGYYRREISRLRGVIEKDLENSGNTCKY